MPVSAPGPVLVGVDAGGTKLQFRMLDPRSGEHWDAVLPAGGWTEVGSGEKAGILTRHIAELTSVPPLAIGIGAHGCDSDEECADLRSAIVAVLPGVPVRVVNDAFLLPLAGSKRSAAGVVIGTGSIVVARTAGGDALYAGGWGWLLGDQASAWGAVRDGVTALARAFDRGEDIELDPLMPALRSVAEVSTLREIADVMERGPAQSWAEWAPVVFEAALAGSAAALAAVEGGVDSLVELIAALLRRGAVIDEVVAGGGVIAHQPLLEERLAMRLRDTLGLELRVFEGDPVEGAIAIARALQAAPRPEPAALD